MGLHFYRTTEILIENVAFLQVVFCLYSLGITTNLLIENEAKLRLLHNSLIYFFFLLRTPLGIYFESI